MLIDFEVIGKVFRRPDKLWSFTIDVPIQKEFFKWPAGFASEEEAQKEMERSIKSIIAMLR